MNTYKNLLLAGLFVLLGFLAFGGGVKKAYAATSGPNTAYNYSTASVGCGEDYDWNDGSYASGSDDAYTSTAGELKSGSCSYYLSLNDFGFSIPAGATINGIQVEIERSATLSPAIADQYVGLLDAGSPVGSNYADTDTDWPTSDDTAAYGGAADLWSNSWTSTSINDSGFGVMISAQGIGDGSYAYIDNVQITITYTPAASNTCQSNATGNWNSAGTWTNCGGGTPGSADTAVIVGAHNVTVTASTTVSALKFGTTGTAVTAGVLKVDSAQTLTVTNAITMVGTAGTATQATIQNGTGNGTVTAASMQIGESVTPSSTVANKLISTIHALTVSGGTTLTGYVNSSTYNNPTLEVQSGTFSTTGITTSLPNASNTATVSMNTGSQAGTLKFIGSTPWTISGTGTTTTNLEGTSSTVEHYAASATVRATTYKNLTFTSSGTYTLGGNTTVSGVATIGTGTTFSLSSHTLTLSGTGTPISRSGTFTGSTGTVNYTSGSGVTALSSAVMTSSNTFYNLTINGSGTFSMGSAFDVANNLTVSAGTLSSSASTTTSGVVSVTGTLTYSGSSTFTHSTTGSKDFGGNGNMTFYNLTFSGGGGTTNATGSGSVTINATLTKSHTFNAGSKTWILTGSGTPFGGSIDNYGTSTFSYRSTTGATLASNISYYNLEIAPPSGTNPAFSVGASNLSIVNNLSVAGVSGTTLSMGSIASYLDMNGTLSISAGNTFTAPPSGATFYIGGNLSNSGTYTHNSGTIQFDSSSTGRTIATGGSLLNNVFFNNASGGWSPSGGAMTLAGDLTMTAGTLSGTQNVTVNGGDVTGNGTINMTGGIFLVDGTSGTGFGGNTGWTFNSLTFGDGSGATTTTATGSGSITVSNTLTIAANQTLNAGSKTWILSGTGTPLSITGTFTQSSSTFQYTGSTATVTATTFNNLTLGGSGTYTMPATTITIKGNLLVTDGASVTKGAGTVVFSGTSGQTITDNNSDSKEDLGNVQDSNSIDAWCNISSTACDSSWLARRKITLDNSALSGNLTDFPVLVSLTSSQIDYSKTQNSGQDIRFVDADGTTALSYEIEKWDESGTSLVWVKVPTVSNNNTDYIYMYYHNVSAADNQAPTSVWDSSFKGIWHMPNGTTLSVADSTSNDNSTSNTSASAASGKVDGGASYNGTSSKIIATASSSLDVSSGAGITVDGWFNPSDVGGMRPLIEWGNGSNTGVHMWNYPSSGKIYVNVVDSGGANHTFNTTGTPLSTSSWQHVAFTYNKSSGAVALYHNGTAQSLDTSNIGAFTPKTNLDFNMGHRPNGGNYYSGSLDEIRVSHSVRSADWIKAEYSSANNTMNSFGSEEVYGTAGLAMGSSFKATTLTIDASKTFYTNGSNTLTLTSNGASVLVVNGAFSASTGTVEFVSVSTTGTTVPALTYNHLTLNKISNTFTAGGNITANNFTITAGTFTAPSSLTVNGDFTNSGTFTHNNGTVVFAPTTLTTNVLGSNGVTFYNLTNTTAGANIKFKSGSTYTFDNVLTATGTTNEPILLSSDAGGSQWTVVFSGTPSLSYVRVKDSACTSPPILEQNQLLFNGGNNDTCWGFLILGGGGGSSGGGAGSSGSSSGGGGSGGGGSSGGGGGSGGSSGEGEHTDSGAKNPGTISNDNTVGTVTWYDPSYATTSDDLYAQATSSNGTTKYLKATNFGFSIPQGATIDGIKVESEQKYGSGGYAEESSIKIVKADGTLGQTNKSTGSTWTGTDAYKVYGSNSDLWGETWTYSDINDSDFGVAISAFVSLNFSFHSDVLVSTPTGNKKIKDLLPGDLVYSFNDNLGTIETKSVLDVWSVPIAVDNNRYYYIYVNGQIVKTTENHRFYVNGAYIRADELKVGDLLMDINFYTHPIQRIDIVPNTTDYVWDISVEDNHNFFADGVLVHNPPGGTVQIDHIRITVYYTIPPPAGQGGGGGGASP